MSETVTRRTILTAFCVASLPIQGATKEIKLPNKNTEFLDNVLPIDNEFIAVDGWVIPASNLVKRVK